MRTRSVTSAAAGRRAEGRRLTAVTRAVAAATAHHAGVLGAATLPAQIACLQEQVAWLLKEVARMSKLHKKKCRRLKVGVVKRK